MWYNIYGYPKSQYLLEAKVMSFVKRSLKKNHIQQILDCFVKLTGIFTSYFDEYFEVIVGENGKKCRFCSIVQEIPQVLEECVKCDRIALEKAKEMGKAYVYSCHMGLYEGVAPVFVSTKLIGYFILGQVKNIEEIDIGWIQIKERLNLLNVQPEKMEMIREAFQEVHVMEREKFEAAGKMLDLIAEYIVRADLIHIYELEKIEKAKNYMDQNFKEHISLEDIAGIVGLSSPYLSSLFKKETGTTIMSYVDMLRLKYAKELLIMTSLSIKEISAMTGYDNQNYFSRVFRKHEKTSAKEYRRLNKN